MLNAYIYDGARTALENTAEHWRMLGPTTLPPA